ncbi:hypothetical protein DL770_008104 [Monosporascus sp. CRB-9-2]|nr:hypothetical protein DL770_008104 [Monosporascus sp. CRB-9-2]
MDLDTIDLRSISNFSDLAFDVLGETGGPRSIILPPTQDQLARYDSTINITTQFYSSQIDLLGGGPVGTLIVTASDVDAPNITDLVELTLDQVTGLEMNNLASVHDLQNVTVEFSLQLGPSVPTTVDNPYIVHNHYIADTLSSIVSVGTNLTIVGNGNYSFVFRELTSVGGDIVIVDNTDCVFNFREVTRLTNLLMRNNPNSTLPGDFLHLEEAESIYLNGIIDTIAGSNIFPSLKRVRGSVVVEAWNKEFNCSKLVALHQGGIINDLRCNGTGNGTLATTETTNEMASPAAISQGAWTGIGVGGGLLFLGALAAVTCLILRSRRRKAQGPGGSQTQNQQQPSSSTHERASGGFYEAGGRPCGSGRAQLEGAEIKEIGGEQVLSEKTGDSIAKKSRFPTARTGHDGPPVELEGCASPGERRGREDWERKGELAAGIGYP